MRELRLALFVTQVIYKSPPAVLEDPFTAITREFNPEIDPFLGGQQLAQASVVALSEERMRIHVAGERAIVRVENPDDDEVAVAKSLAAWDKLQKHLRLTDLGQFSARAVLVADRSNVEMRVLVDQMRSRWSDLPLAAEAINVATVMIFPYDGGRRRIHFGPGVAGHLKETFDLEVPERVFYSADIDHVLGRNVQFSASVRRAELEASLRGDREYAQALLASVERNSVGGVGGNSGS